MCGDLDRKEGKGSEGLCCEGFHTLGSKACLLGVHIIQMSLLNLKLFVNFFKDYLFIYFYRGEGKEKERERNINVWLSFACPRHGDLACNPGMCPDWESNCQPFGSQASTQPLSHTSQGNYLLILNEEPALGKSLGSYLELKTPLRP